MEACLAAHPAKRLPFRLFGPVRRATLARANERRDWRIQADFAQRLIARARRLYAGEALAVELADTVYARDSTTIDLCLSVFPWAKANHQGGREIAPLLDLRGSIPSFCTFPTKFQTSTCSTSSPRNREPSTSWIEAPVPDAPKAFSSPGPKRTFVTRLLRRRTADVLVADQTIALGGPASKRRYPAHLRRIRYRDPASGKTLVFLTNRTDLEALTICDLIQEPLAERIAIKLSPEDQAFLRPLMPSTTLGGRLVERTANTPESRPHSANNSRSCRSCRYKSRSVAYEIDQLQACRQAASVQLPSERTLSQHRLPLRTPVGRASSRGISGPTLLLSKETGSTLGHFRSGCCSRENRLFPQRLGADERRLSLCGPFYPSKCHSPVPCYIQTYSFCGTCLP